MPTTTKLIKLNDGILVEVEAAEDEVRQISHSAAEKVENNLNKVKPLLIKVCKPIVDAWSDLNQNIQIDGAEVEIGLSFEGEGNLYVTKAKAGANLTVKLVFKPKN
jgi:hypothetical protein